MRRPDCKPPGNSPDPACRECRIILKKRHGEVVYVDLVNVDLSRRLSSKVFGKFGAKDEKKRKSWGGRR